MPSSQEYGGDRSDEGDNCGGDLMQLGCRSDSLYTVSNDTPGSRGSDVDGQLAMSARRRETCKRTKLNERP